jgi:hypothetical protein
MTGLFSRNLMRGVGVIIRDDRGFPMISLGQKVPYPGSNTNLDGVCSFRVMECNQQ